MSATSFLDKDGGQDFTSEDEEVLVLFASQAATAISSDEPALVR